MKKIITILGRIKILLFTSTFSFFIAVGSAQAYYFLPAVNGKIKNLSDLSFSKETKIVVKMYSENEDAILTSFEALVSSSGEFNLPSVRYGKVTDKPGNPLGAIPWRQQVIVKLVHEGESSHVATEFVRKNELKSNYTDIFYEMTLIHYPKDESFTVTAPQGLNLKTYVEEALRDTSFLDEAKYKISYMVGYHYRIPVKEQPVNREGNYLTLFVTESSLPCRYWTSGIGACFLPEQKISHTLFATTDRNGKNRYTLTNATVDFEKPFVLRYGITLNVRRKKASGVGDRNCYMNIDGSKNSYDDIILSGEGISFIGPKQVFLDMDLDSVRKKIAEAQWCSE